MRLGKPDGSEADQYVKLMTNGIDVYEYKNSEVLDSTVNFKIDVEDQDSSKLVIRGQNNESAGCH
ncbi:hypothetical protein [Dendrosporobacter sp. 1207_IL3150]|uniref:hypothetical protein n=1 Tax=Dendrosporobacter sp. 1207_IL3150 TaxID=3084054 RepID=UPI002FD8C5E8